MNMKNLHVLQGLIVRKNKAVPQQIEIVATANFKEKLAVKLQWYTVHPETGDLDEGFASAEIEYGDNEAWLADWSKQTHLIVSRIEVLDQLADKGVANRLSRDLAYTLFANLVDYAERYRGMRQVVLNGFEAAANVTLTTDAGGSWTVAPHHIDSVAHLAGFILNGGNAADPRNNFFVTPGWKTMRFAKPLVSGAQYQSYVRMVPQSEAGCYAGDVYILENGEIIGLVEEIQFRTFPRLLLGKLFSPSDLHKPINVPKASAIEKSRGPRTRKGNQEKKPSESGSQQAVADAPLVSPSPAPAKEKEAAEISTASQQDDSVLTLIAAETSIDIVELNDETEFASIGVDSLLSLVLAEKFRDQLGFDVKSSLFIECVNIGGLKGWLAEYC
jgi:iterative type I PKS product template protein